MKAFFNSNFIVFISLFSFSIVLGSNNTTLQANNLQSDAIMSIGRTEVCELKDDKKAVYTFTTDDGIFSAILFFNKEFKRLNLRGSMALICSKLNGCEQGFQAIVEQGYMDVTNHSKTHPKFSMVKDTAVLENEIIGSQKQLKSMFKGQDVITMCNPNVVNTDLADSLIVKSHYAARNGRTGYNSLNPTRHEWYHLNYFATYHYDTNISAKATELNANVDGALTGRNWLIILSHGLGFNRNEMPKEEFTAHFEYVASKSDSLWCGTFNEVTKYLREKQHAAVRVKECNATKIIVSITHDLDAKLFNYPLTLKTRVPSKLKSIIITQAGKSQTVKVQSKNGLSYVYYDAVPNSGDIVLSIK
jgi:beta-galactosidase